MIRLLQIDSFATSPFQGNPAAVCLLGDAAPSERWMQAIAGEMNLSETAYVRRMGEDYGLRWFTPKVEVPLCGHGTLAAAHALWSTGVAPKENPLRFHTLSGVLTCTYKDGWVTMDFPSEPPRAAELPAGFLEALDIAPRDVLYTGINRMTWLIEVPHEKIVRELKPDFQRLAAIHRLDGLVTARASKTPGADFVSRLYAPAQGINEDPVTGAAHCCLGPYWAEKLGKNDLVGYQASERGGYVRVALRAGRALLSGQAVTIFDTTLAVPISQ